MPPVAQATARNPPQPLRVVFDTSTLISAMLGPGSTPSQALQSALEMAALYASAATLEELAKVIERDYLRKYQPLVARREFLRDYSAHTQMLQPSKRIEDCRDSKDNQFLELALVAQAHAIVSSDDDLLVLHPWRDIKIVKPADFLVLLR
jgi:uncharacterized protein